MFEETYIGDRIVEADAAPITPGPAFAYRAFKGFLFGSPDTSPVRPPHSNAFADTSTNSHTSGQTHAHTNDRENMTVKSQEEKDMDLLQGGYVDGKGGNTATSIPSLSPTNNRTKRKFRATTTGTTSMSPAKSILRTPGVMTPRKVMLKDRDVTVTFKDLRISASPEITRKRPTSPAKVQRNVQISATMTVPKQQKEVEKEWEEKLFDIQKDTASVAVVLVPSKKKTTPQPQSQPQLQRLRAKGTEIGHPPPETRTQKDANIDVDNAFSRPLDLDTYMRTAEKEMKKVLRYAQKMRVSAHKQEAENLRLRELLDEMKRENERLNQLLDVDESNIEKREAPAPAPAVAAAAAATATAAALKHGGQPPRTRERKSTKAEQETTIKPPALKSLPSSRSRSTLSDKSRKEKQKVEGDAKGETEAEEAEACDIVPDLDQRASKLHRAKSNTGIDQRDVSPRSSLGDTNKLSSSSTPSASSTLRKIKGSQFEDLKSRSDVAYTADDKEGRKSKGREEDSQNVALPTRSVSTNISRSVENEMVTSTARSVSAGDKLPADRMAAARERLRKRSELRKSSAGPLIETTENDNEFDWAGL